MAAPTAARRRQTHREETGVDLLLAVRGAQAADEREDSATARARAHVQAALAKLREAREADAEHDRQLAQAEELALRLNGLIGGIEQQELPFAQERAS